MRKDKLKAGDVAFDFTVENYELGNQTADAAQKLCANSAEGQHIHLILNNQPYSAYYTADFMKELTDNYYVALAFLSRSYHESIKEKNAYVLWDFVVGDMKEVPSIDLQAPHMFYSRPKGNYVGEGNIENILLDFYLTNVSLSPDGNKVRATIDDKEFMLTSWEPYFISGLGLGEHTVKLELLDNQNQLVQSPFNPVTRKFSLFEDEPLVN
ncbi:MAG: phosphopeptide-binding protein [Chitinophagales bacterium]|nr:phosphopeptide-binding protein [Chitinophagales bacterium]